MNAQKKLAVDQTKARQYMRVESIDRRLLGVLQFEHGLKVYFDSTGGMVVEKSEYESAVAKQVPR